VAGLAAISLLGILTSLPRQPPGVTAGLGERLALAKRRDILGVLVTSVLTVAGTFTVYTYILVSSLPASPGSARRRWRPYCWASASSVRSAPSSAEARRTVGARAVP